MRLPDYYGGEDRARSRAIANDDAQFAQDVYDCIARLEFYTEDRIHALWELHLTERDEGSIALPWSLGVRIAAAEALFAALDDAEKCVWRMWTESRFTKSSVHAIARRHKFWEVGAFAEIEPLDTELAQVAA